MADFVSPSLKIKLGEWGGECKKKLGTNDLEF